MRIGLLFFAIAFMVALSTLSTDVFSQTDQASSADGEAYVKGITSGRARSLIGVVLGIASVTIGWKAKTRKRSWVIAASAFGTIAIIVSIIHLANVTGGFGTGGGKAGAIVAAALGLIGCALNARAFLVQKV